MHVCNDRGSLFSPDPDREGNIITAEDNPCPSVFCDGPSQSASIPHFVTARHKQTCPTLFLPFITRDNIRCFRRATTATSSDEYVIGDIHVQADSLGVPVAFLKLKAHHFGRTPSPCAGRATSQAATGSKPVAATCHHRLRAFAAIDRPLPRRIAAVGRNLSGT